MVDNHIAKDSSSDSKDLKSSQIATMDFESRSGVPGFEIETHDDAFWVPVAFHTDSGEWCGIVHRHIMTIVYFLEYNKYNN